MDLIEARNRIAERLDGRGSADVGVTVEVVAAGWLAVRLRSDNPVVWFHAGVDLHPDGRVTLPPSDDGCTPLGTPHTEVGTATSVDEAVDLVVAEAEQSITAIERLVADRLARSLPAEQPAVAEADLAVACEMWQGGRDSGSSRLRGAARALTGIHHYFRAPFITEHEVAARSQRAALEAGIALLRAVNAAPRLDADGWNAQVGLPARGFAGRGVGSKPDEDPQIEQQLRTGRIEMPLWGVSLSREVADGFGTRFLFEVVGPFPAVPAWVASGIKKEEEELVTGGRYRVLSQEQRGETTHVRLQWFGASSDRVGSDAVLLAVLGALPGVWHSSLTRTGDREVLEVRLEGYGNSATVTRTAGAHDVDVVRYWGPEPDPNAKDDSDWTQYRAIQKASRRMTVPADVAAIAAAVLTER
jgi:hypothetical protein